MKIKATLIAILAVALAGQASAEDCSTIQDSTARLKCFDGAAAALKKQPAKPLAPYKTLVLQNKSRMFKDPGSIIDAKIGRPYDCNSQLGQQQCLCLEANGRNAYGGMTGMDTYVARVTATSVEMVGKMYEPSACGKMEPFPELNGKTK